MTQISDHPKVVNLPDNVKRYNSDWAKAASRKLVRENIEKTLLTFLRPKDITVVFFPGTDAAELSEVFDPLKIPRSNIIGIERERSVFEKLQADKLGIDLQFGEFSDLQRKYPRIKTANVFSKDHIGPVIKQQELDLLHLAKYSDQRHLLIHQANQLRRDKGSLGLYSFYGFDSGAALKDSGNFFWSASTRGAEIEKEKSEGAINPKTKMFALSRLVHEAIVGGGEDQSANLMRTVFGKDVDDAVFRLSLILGHTYGSKVTLSTQSLDEDLKKVSGTAHLLVVDYIQAHFTELLARRLSESPNAIRELAGVLTGVLTTSQGDAPQWAQQRRDGYSYISETGAPMVGEIQFFSKDYRLQSTLMPLRAQVCAFLRSPHAELSLELLKGVRKAGNLISSRSSNDHSPGIFLGNAAKPILTKGRATEAFKAGRTVDEVKIAFRGWSKLPLDEWHAQAGETPSTVEAAETDAEPLSKEDARDLIASGFPLEEIVDAWPHSFTIDQLREL